MESLAYVMDFAAVLAYVQCWTGTQSTTGDTPSFFPDGAEVVKALTPSFPGEDSNDKQKSLVAALTRDRKAVLARFAAFERDVLEGDTCFSSTAESLVERITELLGGKEDLVVPAPSGSSVEARNHATATKKRKRKNGKQLLPESSSGEENPHQRPRRS